MKYMRYYSRYFTVLLLGLFFFLNGCATQSAMESQKNVSISSDHYQMFFGEWKVSEIIGGGRFEQKEVLEKYIGKTVEYLATQVCVDEMEVLVSPDYQCSVLATEDFYYLVGQNAPTDWDSVLDTSASLFVYVELANSINASCNDLTMLSRLFLKDSNTAVLYTDYGYLKLSRQSYPDNYKEHIGGA